MLREVVWYTRKCMGYGPKRTGFTPVPLLGVGDLA